MATLPTLNMMKAQMVIESCETFAQLKVANAFISRVQEMNNHEYMKEMGGMDAWFKAAADERILADLHKKQAQQIGKG